MEGKIFGRSWEDIQTMQGKTFVHTFAKKDSPKPQATPEDITLLEDKGILWLEKKQYFGVIDKLRNSGLID